MNRSSRIGLLVALAALSVSACGGGGTEATSSGGPAAVVLPKTASGKSATVGVANAGGLGQILVDSRGRTLYLFQKDAGTQSACTGECAAAWPPLRATGKPAVGKSLSAAKLGTAARSDGEPQVTYNGHPLYLYSIDQKPGDVNGQGVNAFGAAWYVLSAAGNTITARSSSGPVGY
jgi:predicted lipoprotein with Yx(FWY)xxD motif